MTAPIFHLGFPSPSLADITAPQWAEVARLGEELEFDVLWHSNERFFREMFVRMTVAAMVTRRIQLGGAIAEPFAVHPAITAQSLATVQELSGGRATLALGAGGSGFPMMGIERRKPAVALREAYTVIERMLRGEKVTLEGAVITARDARLHFVPPQPVPLWIATRGDLTLKASGAFADGVLLATYAQPDGVKSALALVAEGAASAGRKLADMRIMTRVDTCVHEDREQAYAGSRLMVTRLLWTSYPDRKFVLRSGLEVPPHVESVIARRDYDALAGIAKEIPDEFVSAFCWAGTPDEVAQRVTAVARAAGLTEIGFWTLRAPGQSLAEAAQLLADKVVPAVRDGLARPAEVGRDG